MKPKIVKKQQTEIVFNQSEFTAHVSGLLSKSRKEVEQIYLSKDTDMLSSVLSGILLRARDEACINRMGFILDRLIGKAEVVTPDKTIFTVEMSDNGRFKTLRPREIA